MRRPTLNATVSNAADSAASALFNANGKALGLVVAQNKVSSSVRRRRSTASDVTVDGDLTVHGCRRGRHLVEHQDRRLVDHHATTAAPTCCRTRSTTSSSGVDYLSTDGIRDLVLGDTVRIHADQATGRRREGRRVRVDGADDGPVDLADPATTTPISAVWSPVPASTAVPSGCNVTNSDSMGIGAAIVLNDVSSAVEAAISNAPSPPTACSVEALESATVSPPPT